MGAVRQFLMSPRCRTPLCEPFKASSLTGPLSISLSHTRACTLRHMHMHMQSMYLVFLFCCLGLWPPADGAAEATRASVVTWINDPEWYYEPLQPPPAPLSFLRPSSLHYLTHFFSKPFFRLFKSATPHDLPSHDDHSSSFPHAPQWLLIHDPEFFNDNLPQSESPTAPSFIPRRLLKSSSFPTNIGQQQNYSQKKPFQSCKHGLVEE